MLSEEIPMQFTRPRFRTEASAEIGPHTAAVLLVGLRAIDVQCPCGYRWTARPGDGHTLEQIGSTAVSCPDCAREGLYAFPAS